SAKLEANSNDKSTTTTTSASAKDKLESAKSSELKPKAKKRTAKSVAEKIDSTSNKEDKIEITFMKNLSPTPVVAEKPENKQKVNTSESKTKSSTNETPPPPTVEVSVEVVQESMPREPKREETKCKDKLEIKP